MFEVGTIVDNRYMFVFALKRYTDLFIKWRTTNCKFTDAYPLPILAAWEDV
jgi:hypothetical protein